MPDLSLLLLFWACSCVMAFVIGWAIGRDMRWHAQHRDDDG